VFLMDSAGNTLVLDCDGVAAKFRNLKTLTVSPALDTIPPNIASFAFKPDSINVAAASAVVTVNFTATDDLSGVVSFQAAFSSPSGATSRSGTANFAAALTRTGSVVVTFPRFSEAG